MRWQPDTWAGYFDERERFVRDYAGADLVANLYQAMSKEGISVYDPFIKLVETQEAELREPYAAA